MHLNNSIAIIIVSNREGNIMWIDEVLQNYKNYNKVVEYILISLYSISAVSLINI